MTATPDNLLEVEIASANGDNLFFMPLNRTVRGRLDFMAPQVRNDVAMASLGKTWERPIPGQIIGLDLATKSAYLREPLHDPEHTATRKRAEKGYMLPPEREEFAKVDVPTFVYWLKRAIEDGNAIVVKGKLPEKIDGEPRLSLFRQHQDPAEARIDKLCGAVEQLVGLVGDLIKAQAAKRS